MTYTDLNALSTKQQSCSIKVKVMRLWESINTKTDELMSMDMVLMDDKVYLVILNIYTHTH